MRAAIVLLLLASSQFAFAYPEMVRHGYTQCTACHVSPAGGGILTAYGRELSSDLLSTWSYTDEGQFLHSKIGAKLAEKGFLFGGDIRAVQTRYKDPDELDGKFFLMQAEFQSAYTSEHFTGVVSIGQIEDPIGPVFKGNVNATLYYGYMKFTDELGLRAGRFMPAYGINDPDHTVVIKQGLGFAPTLQFDSVEASYLTEHWTVLATAARTVENTDRSLDETVRTASVSYSFLNTYRVGASYWSGQGMFLDRHMFNVNGILGFTKHFYNMTEWDFEYQATHPGTKNGVYGLTQFAYEIYRGIVPYLQYQQQQDALGDPGTFSTYYGAGMHLFPRPHFEISGEWDRIKSATQWADSAYLMAHYYF